MAANLLRLPRSLALPSILWLSVLLASCSSQSSPPQGGAGSADSTQVAGSDRIPKDAKPVILVLRENAQHQLELKSIDPSNPSGKCSRTRQDLLWILNTTQTRFDLAFYGTTPNNPQGPGPRGPFTPDVDTLSVAAGHWSQIRLIRGGKAGLPDSMFYFSSLPPVPPFRDGPPGITVGD